MAKKRNFHIEYSFLAELARLGLGKSDNTRVPGERLFIFSFNTWNQIEMPNPNPQRIRQLLNVLTKYNWELAEAMLYLIARESDINEEIVYFVYDRAVYGNVIPVTLKAWLEAQYTAERIPLDKKTASLTAALYTVLEPQQQSVTS